MAQQKEPACGDGSCPGVEGLRETDDGRLDVVNADVTLTVILGERLLYIRLDYNLYQ